MRVGSLFSGIGGFDLGLERAGFEISWQVEIDDYCRKVLRKHWPSVPCHYDIRTIDWREIPAVDLVCGGFPCQPFSSATRGRTTAQNLWPEMRRALEVLKPTWFIGENVVGAASVALGQVASDLEALGYEVAPPLEIPACAVGLDHWRPRYWLLGYSHENRKPGLSVNAEVAGVQRCRRDSSRMGTTNGLSGRLDRLRGLGNAVVPQIVEAIWKMILECSA